MRKDHALAAVVAATIVLKVRLPPRCDFDGRGKAAPARIEPARCLVRRRSARAVPILESHELQGILGRRFAAQPAKTLGRIAMWSSTGAGSPRGGPRLRRLPRRRIADRVDWDFIELSAAR